MNASLLDMAQGFFRGKTLCAMVRLGVADALGDAELSVDELASAIGADRDSLYRLLRASASFGVVAEPSPGRFRLTDFGRPLRRDVPDTAWASIIFWSDLLADSWTHLGEFVRTGDRTAVAAALEASGVKSRWTLEPDPRAIFHAAFAESKAEHMTPFAAAYDFSHASLVADLGCGGGGLVAAILSQYPGPRAILVDRGPAVAGALQLLASCGVADRAEGMPGDLLEAVPRGADVYIMQSVLHGYDDGKAKEILKNVRTAMPASGRLLLIETVLPPQIAAADATLEPLLMADLNMLAVTGGRERTEADWRALLRSGGFDLARVIPVPGGGSIIEADRSSQGRRGV